MPAAIGSTGSSQAAARAKASFGREARIKVLPDTSKSGDVITQCALDWTTRSLWRLDSRYTKSSGPASSGLATLFNAAPASPSIGQPKKFARSPAVRFAMIHRSPSQSSSVSSHWIVILRLLIGIDRGLIHGAGLPSPMYPKPLIGEAPHAVFDRLIETRRIVVDIALLVGRDDELHGGLIAQAIFADLGIPVVKGRNDGCSGAPCQPGNPTGGRSGNSEEIGEDGFSGNRILIRQNSDDSSLVKNAKNRAR